MSDHMPLHQRLVDDETIEKAKWKATCFLKRLQLIIGEDDSPCNQQPCNGCFERTMKMIADRIEGEYISKPRYVTGEVVEIGDMVQEICNCEVMGWEVRNDGTPTLYDEFYGESSGEREFHRAILDADGVPIEYGETLWSTDQKAPCKAQVSRIYEDGLIDVTWEDGIIHQRLRGDWFTHKRIVPDTQEKVDEDARKVSLEYWKCIGRICDTCSVTDDGRNPRELYGVNNCVDAQKLDLLRRQRELDARNQIDKFEEDPSSYARR